MVYRFKTFFSAFPIAENILKIAGAGQIGKGRASTSAKGALGQFMMMKTVGSGTCCSVVTREVKQQQKCSSLVEEQMF